MSLNHAERVAEFLPTIEASDPSSSHAGTTPGSFARAPKIMPGRTRVDVDVRIAGYTRHADSVRQDRLGLHAVRLDFACRI